MENRNCQNCKKNFIIESEDFNFYEKIKVPPPTFCPDCRFQRRLLFRNNRVFYRRECALCKKSVLSVYNKEKNYTVYCQDCWLSDKWDPIDYGQEYDFSIPFFNQYGILLTKVPKSNLYQTNFINSEYCNFGKDFKECYLTFGGGENERVFFSNQLSECKDSLDIGFSGMLEFCYENFECSRSNKLFFSHHAVDCIDSSYLIDCRNCMNCFGCVGIVNKQYYVFNEPYTKDQYEKFIKENLGSYKKHLENLQKVKELELSLPRRYARNYTTVNSTGDDLYECRNTQMAFTSRHVEDSKYLFYIQNYTNKDCYDNCFQGWKSELCYELAHGFGGSNVSFGMRNFNNLNVKYSIDCHDCQNVFGCEGLRKKQYCILNKQYSKEEYEALLPKILKHMEEMPYVDEENRVYKYGEFFPTDLSPFAYNETIAQEYFPLSKGDAVAQGYKWQEGEARNYKIDLQTSEIPDNIKDVNEDILNKVIACEHAGGCKEQCTEAFKIVPEELKFYKRMNLPLPRLCPNCRHYQRINLRNPLKLWDRVCMCGKKGHFHGKEKCIVEFKTSYAPERREIIYCEKCYQQEVY